MILKYCYYYFAVVDSKYEGPRLDDEMTLDFMKEMLIWFKNEKLIHPKYAYKIILLVKDVFSASPSLIDVKIPDVSWYE